MLETSLLGSPGHDQELFPSVDLISLLSSTVHLLFAVLIVGTPSFASYLILLVFGIFCLDSPFFHLRSCPGS